MQIHERVGGDEQRIEALILAESSAKRRDRLRMVLLALRGWEAEQIASTLSSSRRTVQSWVYRYRDGGIEALREYRYQGRISRLNQQQREQFKQRILQGPREADGVCTLRGKDAVAILQREFGVKYSLNGAYKLLHRLGLSCLTPRPRHEKQDPAAQEKFRNESAPLFSER
jgi:transposase